MSRVRGKKYAADPSSARDPNRRPNERATKPVVAGSDAESRPVESRIIQGRGRAALGAEPGPTSEGAAGTTLAGGSGLAGGTAFGAGTAVAAEAVLAPA